MHEWQQYTSKTYQRPYWFNSKTGESVWVKPQARIDYEKEKEERRKIYKQREEQFMKEFETQRIEREKRSKEREETNESYGMCIENGNGMSYTIEGASHWTREDYLEELRNINEAMRDF